MSEEIQINRSWTIITQFGICELYRLSSHDSDGMGTWEPWIYTSSLEEALNQWRNQMLRECQETRPELTLLTKLMADKRKAEILGSHS